MRTGRKLTESGLVNLNRNSSKGNQLKWFDGDKWYKADFLGYEALAEYVISRLLEKSDVEHFVRYDILPIAYRGNRYQFTMQDVLEAAKTYYSKEVLHRVEEVMRNQLHRYSC